MSKRSKKRRPPVDLITEVDDSIFASVSELVGARCVHAIAWEEPLAAALDGKTGFGIESAGHDIDLYLEKNLYFEAYGVELFTDPDEAQVDAPDDVAHILYSLVNQGAVLGEPAVDNEGNLVLILDVNGEPSVYLVLIAWKLVAWEELPA